MLSRGPSQRVALQDGLRSGKEEGGDVLVCMEKYHSIGDKLAMGFTCFTLAVRIFAKTNILDVSDDIFYIYDDRQELFITQEARCLGAFTHLINQLLKQYYNFV